MAEEQPSEPTGSPEPAAGSTPGSTPDSTAASPGSPASPDAAPSPADPDATLPAAQTPPSADVAGAMGAESAPEPSGAFDQASVDELLRQSGFGAAADPGSPPGLSDAIDAAGAAALLDAAGGDALGEQSSIEELLKQASFDDPASLGAAASAAPEAGEFKLPNFQQVMQDAQASSIDLLRDVDLNVKIELGRARMLVEDVLKLSEGSVVELDKLAGDPVDVFVNDRLVARGEVLVLNDNFCVRVNEIVAGVKEEGT